MNLTKILYTVVFGLVLMGCKPNEKKEGIPVTGYDDIVSVDSIDNFISDISCTQLECLPESAISMINKIEIIDSLILVSDFEKVLAFTTEGKFLQKYGVKGNAENEYITVGTFMLDPEKNIVIVDSYSGKLLYFSQDGKYIKTDKIEQSLFANIQDGFFLDVDKIFTSRYIYNENNNVFDIIDITNQSVKEIARTPVRTENTMQRIGIHPFTHNDSNPEWILPFEPFIYDRSTGCLYNIETSQNVYDEKRLQEISDFSIMSYASAIEKDTFLGFTDIFDSNNHIFLKCSNLDGCIIDKKKCSCLHFSLQDNQNIVASLYSGIIANDKDRLISILQPYQFEKIRTLHGSNPELSKIISMESNFDINGNPIVLTFKLS